MGFLTRWLVAFVLIAATYNPTEYNYVTWIMTNWPDFMSVTVLFGLLLFVGYVIYLRATLRSIGVFGMGLVLAIAAALIWVLSDFGLLGLENRNSLLWIGIVSLSLVLGIGLSWSLIRRRLSGQVDMDDVDDDR
ncbi:DUF6524 family protein [Oceanicola sp. S124]|uniref:DUF6524 family protein n=1 Tax=Oceanicola sp. S124 TaxID=1042378 RepID=UPI00025590A2|nr:DUF6524 family protein [Oceanicola sp. S124]